MAKFLVTLTDEERCLLRKMVSSGKGAARKLLHGRILLQADASPEGMRYPDEAIAEALGVSLSTIHRVRQQFVEESFEVALNPRRPLRRPDKVTIQGEVEQHLIALACGEPPRGHGRWTVRLLADRMVEWQVKTWCIPPKANADFVYHMEDVLRVYQLPYDRRYPVVCMDEASKQLIGEVNAPLPLRSGRVKCEDYEYERKGVCNQFMCCEPLRGWRHVRVTARRTKRDWAECIRELVDVHSSQATRIRLVLDNLNTHTGASLYEAFPPDEARRLLDRLEFHHTPKHASWLNMAEIEIGVLNGQCLDRRLDNADWLRSEISAWEERRNKQQVKIHWSFTIAVARHKLKKLYPVIEDRNPPT